MRWPNHICLDIDYRTPVESVRSCLWDATMAQLVTWMATGLWHLGSNPGWPTRVFHPSIIRITFRDRSAHLAYHVHKSGHKAATFIFWSCLCYFPSRKLNGKTLLPTFGQLSFVGYRRQSYFDTFYGTEHSDGTVDRALCCKHPGPGIQIQLMSVFMRFGSLCGCPSVIRHRRDQQWG